MVVVLDLSAVPKYRRMEVAWLLVIYIYIHRRIHMTISITGP